ncbi:MAG: hypothetical protein Q8S84_01705 [bacterium]|nr:hypothetical protein [bacterium]
MYPLGQREYPQGEGLETKYKIILNLMALCFSHLKIYFFIYLINKKTNQ